jgi:hypothetical protein
LSVPGTWGEFMHESPASKTPSNWLPSPIHASPLDGWSPNKPASEPLPITGH